MTSAASKIPDLLEYLVTTFKAADTLGAADPPVTVFDGNEVTAIDPPLTLWVGLDDPDTDGATVAAESTRDWVDLAGGLAELITVYGVAESWSGGTDMAAEAALAFGILAAVEVLVDDDASGFGGNGVVRYPGVTGVQLKRQNTERGAQARVSFQIVLKVL